MGTYSNKFSSLFINKYKEILKNENSEFLKPQYTIFQAKTKDFTCTFYESGKVVIQGKNIDSIVEKLFGEKLSVEKVILSTNGDIAPYPHIGVDESGKGDFFGPLVAAGCYLTKELAEEFKNLGAMDSKKLNDKKILELSDVIKEKTVYDVVVITNPKYNSLYSSFQNLNKLLAWAHATVFENLLKKTECKTGISDKFGDDRFILNALKTKGKTINLIQVPKAESDTAVACASILARAEFVKRISKLSYDYGMNLPKGANDLVLQAGRKIIEKYGIEELKNVSKTHFKTYQVLNENN